MDSDDQYFECNEPNVIFERFDDETILINLDSGHYYSLDPVGVAIWELISNSDHPESTGSVIDRLTSHFDADADAVTTAVVEFIGRLREEGLIRRRDMVPIGKADGVAIAITAGTPFSAPVIAKYDDMAEMLLLDPVHDVDEAAGWPQPAPPDSSTPTSQAAAVRVEDDDVSSWPSLDDEK
jgi:hypothetical protein